MTLTYQEAEHRLRTAPPPFPLRLPEGQLPPRYDGYSIANIAPTLAGLFGAPFASPLPPLAPEVLGDLGQDVDRVLLFVFDAVGWSRLLPLLEQGRLPTLQSWLAHGAHLHPLTSIFPSTTTAATTSIWTGTAPSHHGLLGLNLFLRDQGMVATVLFERPAVSGREGNGLLTEWGAPLATLVGVPSMATQLAQAGIETRAFILQALVGSSLSTVHYQGARLSGVSSLTDLAVSAMGALERRARIGRRAIIGGYWDTVDLISHAYGPNNARWGIEVEQLFYTLDQALCLLPREARSRTLLLVVADHGHIAVDPQKTIRLTDHPALLALLDNRLGGDSRASYLYSRHVEEARAYVEQHLSHAFHALLVEEALEGGLWGPPPFHPDARSRLGDLLLLARESHSLLWGPQNSGSLGYHGGTTAEEMLVPLIARRLDD